MNILQNTLFPRENEFSPEGFESFLASREFESPDFVIASPKNLRQRV